MAPPTTKPVRRSARLAEKRKLAEPEVSSSLVVQTHQGDGTKVQVVKRDRVKKSGASAQSNFAPPLIDTNAPAAKRLSGTKFGAPKHSTVNPSLRNRHAASDVDKAQQNVSLATSVTSNEAIGVLRAGTLTPNCHLLGLPAELRQKILSFVADDTTATDDGQVIRTIPLNIFPVCKLLAEDAMELTKLWLPVSPETMYLRFEECTGVSPLKHVILSYQRLVRTSRRGTFNGINVQIAYYNSNSLAVAEFGNVIDRITGEESFVNAMDELTEARNAAWAAILSEHLGPHSLGPHINDIKVYVDLPPRKEFDRLIRAVPVCNCWYRMILGTVLEFDFFAPFQPHYPQGKDIKIVGIARRGYKSSTLRPALATLGPDDFESTKPIFQFRDLFITGSGGGEVEYTIDGTLLRS